MQNNKNLTKKKCEENNHFKNYQIYKIIIHILYIKKFKAKK